MIIDAHAHIHSTDENAYPSSADPLRPPAGTGTIELLQREMRDAAVDRARGEMEVLGQYHARMIDAVVTSKLDLGETAAQLPEEPDEPEQFDEVESQASADHDLDNVDLDGAFGHAEV